MRYDFVLIFNTKNPGEIYNAICCEAGKDNRSELDIKKEKIGIRFTASAKDHIALKAAMNTISKILTICEKTEAMIENGRKQNSGKNQPAPDL